MSLLGDTIRDAHRPLPSAEEGQLRRMVFPEDTESSPKEEHTTSELQTVFRFQKEGQPSPKTGPREASFRPGAADTGLPAGDPLSVESTVERPSLFTSDVNGNEDIFSVKGDNRGNELETGQSNHGSPSWTTAAKMSAVSSTHQSEVMSEPNESVSAHQRHQSREQNGSGRTVSEQEETYQSRIPGQGAPSESFSTAPITPLRSVSPGPTPVERPHVPGQTPRQAEAVPGQAVESFEAVPGEAGPQQPEEQKPRTTLAQSGAPREQSGVQEPVFPTQAIESQPSAPSSGPHLVIGRIDVVVVADSKQASSGARVHTRSDSGFVSRNYLKRL
ncbi:hypothetical protein JWJ90_02560 [Desulfobulbus rhabdoformis]|uniref:hypothetical protein n=1 Tax=Desulfobulbus rhabdoformis TaxID=34032 RepID=UPI0019656D21|nr:hypothetical protein [Desulfobulbus rhabdoformis]MBM9613163.1 hypothetical protein [Desulfobulbus rhabdoformis]